MTLFLIDFFVCLFLHLAPLPFLARRKVFNPESFLFHQRPWEKSGNAYERLGVRRWKDHLPNCGSFSKKSLSRVDSDYLKTFVNETCRAEAIHLSIIAPSPLFFLFNPPIGGVIIVLYLLLENAPCVIAQRYNRIRLTRLISQKDRAMREGRLRKGVD